MLNDFTAPTGGGAESVLWRRLKSFLDTHTVRDIEGYKRQPSASGKGVNWKQIPQPSRGGGTNGPTLQLFAVREEFPTYLECFTYNNGNQGSTLIKVAKPFELQNTARQSAAYGQTFNFSPLVIGGQTSPNKRQESVVPALNPPLIYNAVIMPNYLQYSQPTVNKLWAIQIPSSQVQPDGITWLDLNLDARIWKKEVVVCAATAGTQAQLSLIDATCTYPQSEALNFLVI
jgi:hypothetical protein